VLPVARVSTNATYMLEIEVKGSDIIVSLPSARFTAVYYKPAGQPQLILRQRSKCDDYELLAEVYQAAVSRARKLGWLVIGWGHWWVPGVLEKAHAPSHTRCRG
jgi:hypothetical protein